MPAGELKRRWSNGEVAYGAAIRLSGTWAAEVFAHAGLDFVYVDLQHGFVSVPELVPILQALNGTSATSIVRVTSNDPVEIGKVLDAGAEGIIVPMVESADEAARAVAACRFGKGGTRSRGDLRLKYLPGGADRELICLVMIETEIGVAHVSDILDVPGIDGVFVGPADLATSLGLPPRSSIQPGPHADAISAIRRACDDRGKVTAITGDPQEMKALGFRCINLGGDSIFIEAGLAAALARR